MHDVFNGKNIAITGANGFVGSWLTETLVKSGAKATVLITQNSPIGMSSLEQVKGRIKVINGDIRDRKAVDKLVEGNDTIFHLAALTQVLYSKNKPTETFDVNLNGTLALLESIRSSKENPFLVYMSTDKVYGEPEKLPITEENQLSGKSPYDVSKLAAERAVGCYVTTYGLKSGTVRCSNIIGGRDSNILRATPDFITSILNGKEPVIRGNGKHIRDYMYVADVVEGLLMVGNKTNISNGEVFNLGTERPTSVVELAQLIIKEMKPKGITKPVILGNKMDGEIDKQYLSSKKAKDRLGWKPKFELEESLRETIAWYRENKWWQNVMQRSMAYYNYNTIK